MHSSPAEVLRKWLVSQGLALDPPTADWSCYVAGMPETPDKALCVYETSGILQGRIQRTGETIEHFGIQIRVRAATYQTGWVKARAICDAFDALQNAQVTLDTHTYKINAVTRKSSILHIGPEQNNKRERFTINFLATIRELS